MQCASTCSGSWHPPRIRHSSLIPWRLLVLRAMQRRWLQPLVLVGALLSAAVSIDAQACGFGGMDFTSISTSDLAANVTSTSLGGVCMLRICGVLDSALCRNSMQGGVADASACLLYTEPAGTVTVGGVWDDQVVWSYVRDDPSQGVQYTMHCDGCAMAEASAVVTFTCSASFGPIVASGSPYTQYYSVPTRQLYAAASFQMHAIFMKLTDLYDSVSIKFFSPRLWWSSFCLQWQRQW